MRSIIAVVIALGFVSVTAQAAPPQRVLRLHRSISAGYKAVLPLSTQTYMGPGGRVTVASNPQPRATGFSPSNGTRTGNGYTVFNNHGGAGTAMGPNGNIVTGHFDIRPSTGQTIFVPHR